MECLSHLIAANCKFEEACSISAGVVYDRYVIVKNKKMHNPGNVVYNRFTMCVMCIRSQKT